MRITVFLLLLVLASTISGQPTYPREFDVRGCSVIDGHNAEHPDQHCTKCNWIRTDDGWMVSCQ
jgi:hypothetical protein